MSEKTAPKHAESEARGGNASTLSRNQAEDNLPRIGAWAFIGFGALMIVVGLLIAVNDTAGLFASLFGAVFVGAGFLVRKLFRTPAGRKSIVVSGFSFAEGTTRRSHQVSIYVNEDATDEEIAEAKIRWATEGFYKRPDWVEGAIRSDRSTMQGGLVAAAIILFLITAVMITLAVMFGDVWPVFAGIALVVCVIFGIAMVRDVLHRRKFREAVLTLEEKPPRLGGVLRGEIVTGVPPEMQSHAPFSITLRCDYQWEETVRSGKDRRTEVRTRTLWEKGVDADPIVELSTTQRVRIDLEIPDGLPETTLSTLRPCIRWRLGVHLPLAGLDYREEFTLPVLSPDTRIDPSLLKGPAAAA